MKEKIIDFFLTAGVFASGFDTDNFTVRTNYNWSDASAIQQF